MNRIDGANYVTVGGKRQFSEGSPGVTPPTSLTPKWFTDAQEEIIAGAIEAAGLTPTDSTVQLTAALRLLGLNAQNAAPFKGSAHAGPVRTYLRPGADGTNGTRLDITINAAWDAGGSQWVPDVSTSPSIMFRMAAGASGSIIPASADIGVFRNDSGAAFAESAWVRGINGGHGLSYGAHWADGGVGGPGTYKVGLEGRVWLNGGLANDGSAGTVATLPSGARPASIKQLAAVAYNGSAYVITPIFVATSGDITTGISGSGSLLFLDGLSFPLSD